jgi:hypothetical protein
MQKNESEKRRKAVSAMNQFREFEVENKKVEIVPVPIGVAGEKISSSSMSTITALSSADDLKPRVHFARKKTFRGIESFNLMSMKQRDSLWYTSAELEMKKHHEVREIFSDSGLLPIDSDIQEINKMFLHARWLSNNTSAAESDEILRDSEALKQFTEGLDRFLEAGTSSGRGLEEWIFTPEQHLRREAARASRVAFITASSKLARIKSKDCQDEILVEEYRKQSRPAKIYARLIAEADASAVVAKSQGGCEEDKKQVDQE